MSGNLVRGRYICILFFSFIMIINIIIIKHVHSHHVCVCACMHVHECPDVNIEVLGQLLDFS